MCNAWCGKKTSQATIPLIYMMACGRVAHRGTSSWTRHVLWPMSNYFALCASSDIISLCVTQMKQLTDQQRKAGKHHVVRSGNVVYLRPWMYQRTDMDIWSEKKFWYMRTRVKCAYWQISCTACGFLPVWVSSAVTLSRFVGSCCKTRSRVLNCLSELLYNYGKNKMD